MYKIMHWHEMQQNNLSFFLKKIPSKTHLGSCISRTDVKALSNLMMSNHCMFQKTYLNITNRYMNYEYK